MRWDSDPALAVDTRREGKLTVISVAGELDLASAPSLGAAIERAEADGAGPVVVDLTGLDFLGSTGIGLLARSRLRFERAGRRFDLRNVPESAQRVLDLTGLGDRFASSASFDCQN